MKKIVIFEKYTFVNFPITLFDIFLGLFTASIVCRLFYDYFSDDDDYQYSFNYSIFEDYYYENLDDVDYDE